MNKNFERQKFIKKKLANNFHKEIFKMRIKVLKKNVKIPEF